MLECSKVQSQSLSVSSNPMFLLISAKRAHGCGRIRRELKERPASMFLNFPFCAQLLDYVLAFDHLNLE